MGNELNSSRKLFSLHNLKKSDHLIDEDIDRKIILKINLKFLGYDDGK